MKESLERMSNTEFFDYTINHMMEGWVPLRTYLAVFQGETRSSVSSRIARGSWTRGVEFNVPKGGSMWINLRKVRLWVEADAGTSAGLRRSLADPSLG